MRVEPVNGIFVLIKQTSWRLSLSPPSEDTASEKAQTARGLFKEMITRCLDLGIFSF